MRFLIPALLLATSPALAKDGKKPHAEPAHQEEPAHDDHGDAGHEDAAHGDEEHHGGHHYYTDDDDHDGIPNWRDAMNGAEPNTETYVLKSIGFHVFNLLILLGILVYALRRPMADAFRDRALGIRKQLTDSARSRDESHQRHQELVARLEKIEGEVATMHVEAGEEAAREEAKLIERAEREATRITEQAERTIREEATRARNALRREAVELACRLAEETLKSQVASTDQQALARDFLTSLKQDAEEAPHGYNVIARRYAQAMIEIAIEAESVDVIGTDLVNVTDALQAHEGLLGDALASPVFTIEERTAVLDQVLPKLGLNPLTANLLRLANDKRRFALVPAIAEAYAALADERAGRARVVVQTAEPLTPQLEAEVRAALETATGKSVVLTAEVAPELIGGMVARVGGTVYDSSIRTRLEQIRGALLQSQLTAQA